MEEMLLDGNFSERIARYSIWLLWGLMAIGAILWLLVGSVAYWVRDGWLPADSAGWVQAIGAFIAIAVAIALPYFQSRQQQTESRAAALRERLDGRNATYALMHHMESLYKRLKVYIRPSYSLFGGPLSGAREDSLLHELKQAASMLREIPVTAISNEMVFFVIGLREVANYGEFVANAIESRTVHQPDWLSYRSKAFANHELLVRWMKELDELEMESRK
jgi:uncharacterized membrane protein YuzA (DUF378 family)